MCSTRRPNSWPRTWPSSLADLIAEQAGQPVACVRVSQNEPSRINLWRLAVLPEAQGAGLGRLIIDAIERWAVAWGRPNVTLAALEASPEESRPV